MFTQIMVAQFGKQYLNRCPTDSERQSISRIMASKGFPGCLASWDCNHFNWKNCPLRLAGQYSGKEGKNTFILEAISDHRRYVWYANFGDAGSLNDINVLERSSIVGAMLLGNLAIAIKSPDSYTISQWKRKGLDVLPSRWYLPRVVYLCQHFLQTIRGKEEIFCKATGEGKKRY